MFIIWRKQEQFKVAQQGYARSRSVRQWPQSKVNILILFAIFPNQSYWKHNKRGPKFAVQTVTSDIKALSLK